MKEYNRKKWMDITLTIATFIVAGILGIILMVIYAFFTPSPNDTYENYLLLLLILIVGGGYGTLVILFNKYTWIYHILFFISLGLILIFTMMGVGSILTSFPYVIILLSPYLIFYIRDLLYKIQKYKNKGERQ